jgi:hypothetical protein
MTDLVKRLRIGIHTSADEQVLRDEAADRIEHLENRCANLLIGTRALNIRSDKLETALRHCINALREYEMGDDRPRGPIPNDDLRPWLLGAMDNARKALEENDD